MSNVKFWKKVDKNGPNHTIYGKCWVWLGSESFAADRKSWKIHYSLIPAGRYVCHSCDNPLCVRPDHLWLGTNKQNINDAKMKGRMRGPSRVEVDKRKKYGRLKILRACGPGHSYKCKCDCGKMTIVMGRNLTNGHTRSCGCYNRERLSQVHKGHKYNVGRTPHNKLDRTGIRYGRLVATLVDSSDKRKWVCRCDCGMKTSVLSTNLANYSKNNRGCAKCQRKRS